MKLKALGLAGLLLLSNCQTGLSEPDKEKTFEEQFANPSYVYEENSNISDEVIPKKITDSPEKKQTLTFSFFNDNTGIPALDKILNVDDYGYTYGSKISYGIDLEKNHLNIDYLTNLYTRRRIDLPIKISDDGRPLVSQDFVDEILLIATIDNKKQANPLYNDYSFGFLSLDSYDDDFFLTASVQQKFFHNLMGLNIPDNQENKSASQLGLVFGFHQGLYLPIRLCDWLNLSMDLKFGGRLCTIPHASYLDFVASTDLTIGKSLIAKLNFSSNMMLHDKGLKTILSLSPSIGIEGFQFGINILQPFGNSFQIYKFDDKKEEGHYDLIVEYFFKFGF